MITETILNKFRNNIKEELIEETIHLAHGTKSVKVITHKDLDGITSAITIVDQLKKQGVKNIRVEFAQYGDKDLEKDMAQDNKDQRTLMTDFARVDTVNIWKDISYIFWNEQDAERNIPKIVKMINTNLVAFQHMKKEQFIKLLKITFPNANALKMGEISRFDKDGKLAPSAGWKTGVSKKGSKQIEELLKGLAAYSKRISKDNPKNKNEIPTERITEKNIKTYEIPLSDLDMTVDHHGTKENGLTPGRSGEIGINSPSECSDAARKYNPGAWSKKDLEAIDMIDSAGYTPQELIGTASLQKNFTGPNKERGLAIIINSIIGQCIKNDEQAAKWLVLNSGTSLVSLYTNLQKAYKFNSTQLKLMDAIKDGNFQEAKKLSDSLPKELRNKWWDKGFFDKDHKEIKNVKYMANLYQIRNGAKSEFEQETSGRITDNEKEELKKIKAERTHINTKEEEEELNNIKALKKVPRTEAEEEEYTALKKIKKDKRTEEQAKRMEELKNRDKRTEEQKARQNTLEHKDRRTEEQKARQEYLENKAGHFEASDNFSIQHGNAGRFDGSLLSFGGKRNPFTVKKFPMGMIQASRSPMYKGDIDFFKVAEHVKKDVESYMKTLGIDEKTIRATMESMEKESGGHEAIYNLQGFKNISEPKNATWADNNAVERAEALAKKKFGDGKETMKQRQAYVNSIIPNIKAKVNSDKKKEEETSTREKVMDYAARSFIKWTNKLYPVDETKLAKEIKNNDPKFEVRK